MRINKYIADCGVASRRKADELVTSGKVKINGKTVTELGTDVNEQNDSVTVDGIKIKLPSQFTYILFYKPKGCVCTAEDEKGRKTIYDYLPPDKRVFNVGRLDYDSEGMLLMTNDGELAHKLSHPSNEIPKTYIVRVEGEVAESTLATLRNGVELDGVRTKRARIKVLGKEQNGDTRLEFTITEGKNRQIRRMCETQGKTVTFIKRIAIGDLRLGGLPRGGFRYLTEGEVEYLKQL